jgi:hypothetical protein
MPSVFRNDALISRRGVVNDLVDLGEIVFCAWNNHKKGLMLGKGKCKRQILIRDWLGAKVSQLSKKNAARAHGRRLLPDLDYPALPAAVIVDAATTVNDTWSDVKAIERNKGGPGRTLVLLCINMYIVKKYLNKWNPA